MKKLFVEIYSFIVYMSVCTTIGAGIGLCVYLIFENI